MKHVLSSRSCFEPAWGIIIISQTSTKVALVTNTGKAHCSSIVCVLIYKLTSVFYSFLVCLFFFFNFQVLKLSLCFCALSYDWKEYLLYFTQHFEMLKRVSDMLVLLVSGNRNSQIISRALNLAFIQNKAVRRFFPLWWKKYHERAKFENWNENKVSIYI